MTNSSNDQDRLLEHVREWWKEISLIAVGLVGIAGLIITAIRFAKGESIDGNGVLFFIGMAIGGPFAGIQIQRKADM